MPVEFFGQTDAIYGAPISVHAPMWRKKSNVSATELHRIVAELNVRVMHLRKLLEATDLDPVNKVPRFDADEYDNDAEKIAGLLRRFWHVPDGPIQDLTTLVEEAGILVAHSDLGGSTVSGVRFSVPSMPHIIVLNRQQPADRMRFTLCHELGHVIMHGYLGRRKRPNAPVTQLDRVLPSEGKGHTFETCQARQIFLYFSTRYARSSPNCSSASFERVSNLLIAVSFRGGATTAGLVPSAKTAC